MSVAYTALIIFQALLGVMMVILILLHAPKGEGMGGIGGSAMLFSGKRGAEAGIDRVTWIVVGSFLVICMVLGFGFVR